MAGNRAVLLDAGRQQVMLGEEEKEMFIVDCEQEENVSVTVVMQQKDVFSDVEE